MWGIAHFAINLLVLRTPVKKKIKKKMVVVPRYIQRLLSRWGAPPSKKEGWILSILLNLKQITGQRRRKTRHRSGRSVHTYTYTYVYGCVDA